MEHRRDVPGGDIRACTAGGSCRGPESASGSQGVWVVAGDGTEDAAVRGAARLPAASAVSHRQCPLARCCVLATVSLRFVEIELILKPLQLLPFKGGSDLSSRHLLAASGALRRRREILRVVSDLQLWRVCHTQSLRWARVVR